MDIEDVLGTMIRGSLGTRRKRSHGVDGFLLGGRSPFLNASTLLTVGGLIWGAIESMQQQSSTQPAPPTGWQPPAAGPVPRQTPPLPTTGGAPPIPNSPPPLPTTAGGADTAPAPSSDASSSPVPDGAVRLVKLMVSAARADGQASDIERRTILAEAAKAGVEDLVNSEWARPTPLSAIVGEITDPQQRADLYVLAYAIVRADETVNGAERIYLAQLASKLNLDKTTTARLEQDADVRIERERA
jgi:hypothetical protein